STSVLLICRPEAAPAVTCRATSIGRRRYRARRTLAGVPRNVDDLADVEDPELRDCVPSSLWPAALLKNHDPRQSGFMEIPLQYALQAKEAIMRKTFSDSVMAVAIAGSAISIVISVSLTQLSAQ